MREILIRDIIIHSTKTRERYWSSSIARELDRMQALAETGCQIDETNLIRDVNFSDRRRNRSWRCHLDQLAAFLNEKSSGGNWSLGIRGSNTVEPTTLPCPRRWWESRRQPRKTKCCRV